MMKNASSNFFSTASYNNALLVLLGFFLLVTASPLDAQNRWALEFRPGASFATEQLGGADLGTGFGFEGTVAYRVMPQHLSAYAGWGWNQFAADRSFAGTDVQFEETGYTFGLLFIHPFGGSRLNYLIQVGGLANHIEVENEQGDIIADSGHGLGWQVGAGLAIPLGERWRLTPSVRYRSLSRDIELNDVTTPVDLNYVSAGVGLGWLF